MGMSVLVGFGRGRLGQSMKPDVRPMLLCLFYARDEGRRPGFTDLVECSVYSEATTTRLSVVVDGLERVGGSEGWESDCRKRWAIHSQGRGGSLFEASTPANANKAFARGGVQRVSG